MTESRTGRTVVVGAGLAGLVAANEWRDAGEDVVVAEKESFVGGMARSIRRNGFTFDIGPHYIFERTKWHDILFEPDELLPFAPVIWLIVLGRWIRYPFSPASMLKVPATVHLDFLRTRLTGGAPSPPDQLDPDSFAHRMSGVYGGEMFQFFFRPYLTRKMGGNDLCDALHRDWWSMAEHDRGVVSRPEAAGPSDTTGGLRVASRLARFYEGIAHAFRASTLHYPRGGFGAIGERLSQRVLAAGGELRLEAPVDNIVHDGNRITAVVVGDEEIPVKRLIWTGSPGHLASLLDVAPLELPTLHSLTYLIELDKRYPRRGTEVRPLADNAAFYRCYFPEMISPDLVPEGRSGIVAEAGTTSIGEVNRAADRYDSVIDTCVRTGLCPSANAVTDITHVTVPNCYPIYLLDYEQHLRRFYEGLSPFSNLMLAGRNARFQYVNSNRAMAHGTRTREDRLF